jgi:hypothetical protein
LNNESMHTNVTSWLCKHRDEKALGWLETCYTVLSSWPWM